MLCTGCGKDSGFLAGGRCLSCLWRGSTPETVKFGTCVNCGVTKPVDLFKGNDNTCSLCRKLMSVVKTRYSHKIGISQGTMLGLDEGEESDCVSCTMSLAQDEFPPNSFECYLCWGTRNLIELAKIGELYDGSMNCFMCNEIVLYSKMPTGRLICRSCINRLNGQKERGA